MRRRRVLQAGAGLTAGIAALSLIGCGSDDSGSEPEDKSGLLTQATDSTSKAKKGGVWLSSFQNDTPHFDGMLGGSSPWWENHFAYGYLVKAPVFNKTKGEEIDTSVTGDVAESWEQSPDGLTITFKLRPNAGLDPRPPTSGRNLDADDVVLAWNRFVATSSNKRQLSYEANKEAPIESITAVDKNTVRAKLAFPSASVLAALADYRNFMLVPREVDGGYDPKKEMRGSGPWMLDNYQPSIGFSYKRNPNYWDKERPYLDGIERPIISEYAAGLAQLKAGNLATWNVRAEDIIATKNDAPHLDMYQVDQYTATNRSIGFSFKEGSPFRDERVRRAASMLIDRDLFIDATTNAEEFNKQGLPVDKAWFTLLTGSDLPFYIDPQSSAFGASSQWLKYNPEEAKKLIRAATGKDTIETKWTYTTNGYNSSYIVEQEILKNMLEAEGDFKFSIEAVDFTSVFTPKLRFVDSEGRRPEFDGMAYFNFSGAPDPDIILASYYMPGATEYRMEPDWPNDAKFNQLTSAQRTELNEEKRVAIIQDVQRHHIDKMYTIPRPGDAKAFTLWQPYMQNLYVYGNRLSAPLANNVWLYYWRDQSIG